MLRGDRLRELREKRGLTREELTAELGLSANQVYRYETGANDATGKVIVRIAQFFEVSSDYLLGLSNERQCHPQHFINVPVDDEQFGNAFAKVFGRIMVAAIVEALTGEEAERLSALQMLTAYAAGELPLWHDDPDSPHAPPPDDDETP